MRATDTSYDDATKLHRHALGRRGPRRLALIAPHRG